MINLLEIHAREIVKMSDDWKLFSYRAEGEKENAIYVLVGSVPRIISRGKNKGKKDWKANPETQKTVYIRPTEHEAWKVEWSIKTGNCSHCGGDGLKVISVSVKDGTKTKPCEFCGGTGRVQ